MIFSMQKISEQKNEYVFAKPLFRLLSYLVRSEQLSVWSLYHSTQTFCTFLVSPSIFCQSRAFFLSFRTQ